MVGAGFVVLVLDGRSCEKMPLSPEGAKESSPGRQPWETAGKLQFLWFLGHLIPGLAPWATLFRPFGAKAFFHTFVALGRRLHRVKARNHHGGGPVAGSLFARVVLSDSRRRGCRFRPPAPSRGAGAADASSLRAS